MTSFLTRKLAALKHVTIDNPLFYYRLRKFNIYTWSSLFTLFILLLMAYCTTARLSHFIELHHLQAVLPPVLQGEQLIGGAFNIANIEYEAGHFSSFTFFSESALFCLQIFCIIMLYSLLYLGAYQSSRKWNRKQWNHPNSPHIRLLPISRNQLLFALIDLNFFTRSICLMLGILMLLGPAFDTSVRAGFQARYFAWGAAIVWAVTFSVYRYDQYKKTGGTIKMNNQSLKLWGAAIALVLIFPYFLTIYIAGGTNIDFRVARLISIFCSLSVASIILLVACSKMKSRLLEHSPPE